LHGSATHTRFYTACVVNAVEHLHQRSIIHRDLKPENCLLDDMGYCKVSDFGLAKFVIGHTFTTCGTPEYFAPEMIKGTGHTSAIDWWALGIFIYELMMSEPPFSAENPMCTFRKVQQGIEVVKFPRDRTWPLLVKALCQKEPSERLPVRKGGTKAIKEHSWFKEESFDWVALNGRSMQAPYLPEVKSSVDTGNFEASMAKAPRDVPYDDPGNGWDKGFEETQGLVMFDRGPLRSPA